MAGFVATAPPCRAFPEEPSGDWPKGRLGPDVRCRGAGCQWGSGGASGERRGLGRAGRSGGSGERVSEHRSAAAPRGPARPARAGGRRGGGETVPGGAGGWRVFRAAHPRGRQLSPEGAGRRPPVVPMRSWPQPGHRRGRAPGSGRPLGARGGSGPTGLPPSRPASGGVGPGGTQHRTGRSGFAPLGPLQNCLFFSAVSPVRAQLSCAPGRVTPPGGF